MLKTILGNLEESRTPPPFMMIQETETEKARYLSWKTKEPETLSWIDSFNDGILFFDIGANVGIYSLYCAAVHPECRIFAFEPDRKNYRRLASNAIRNRFPLIIPYQVAVSDTNRTVMFSESSEEIGSSGGQIIDGPVNGTRSYPVESTTIDTLAGIVGCPAHVKIDIDGQELRVVRGMRRTLHSPALRSVLIEIDLGDGKANKEILGAFLGAGFGTANRFNSLPNHSHVRRAKEGINVENVIFTRGN